MTEEELIEQQRRISRYRELEGKLSSVEYPMKQLEKMNLVSDWDIYVGRERQLTLKKDDRLALRDFIITRCRAEAAEIRKQMEEI